LKKLDNPNHKIYFIRNSKEYLYDRREKPNYDCLVLTRSENTVIFDKSEMVDKYKIHNEGELVSNTKGILLFKHKFHIYEPAKIEDNRVKLGNKRSCDRDSRDHNLHTENFSQFYTQSIFDSWFDTWGEFATVMAWGIKTGPFSGSPTQITKRFKIHTGWRGNWLTPSNVWNVIPILYWNDNISREIKFIFVEEDNGATLTIGATLGASFKVDPNTTFNASLNFNYSIKNDHDQIGETIVRYCDEVFYTQPGQSEPGYYARFTPNVAHRQYAFY
jgi:hypothetical protein